jgi:hypothetical protein
VQQFDALCHIFHPIRRFLPSKSPPKWPCVWTPEYQIVKTSLSVLDNYRVRLITRSILRGGKCGKLGATNTFVKGIINVTYVVIIPAGWRMMQWLLLLRYVTTSNDVNWFNINVRLFRALINDNKPHGWDKTGWHLRDISSPPPTSPAEVTSLSFWLPRWCKFGKLPNCILYKNVCKTWKHKLRRKPAGLSGGRRIMSR